VPKSLNRFRFLRTSTSSHSLHLSCLSGRLSQRESDITLHSGGSSEARGRECLHYYFRRFETGRNFEFLPLVIFLIVIGNVLGCAMSAPIHLWRPARNQDRPIHRIAIAPVYGPRELASKLDESMIALQPQIGSSIVLLHPKLLEEITSIQLANYDGQPSDVAGLSAARRAQADIYIQGQIVHSRTEPQAVKEGFWDWRMRPAESVTVAWTVTDVQTGERLGESTVKIDREEAEKQYPDLKLLPGAPIDKVIQGITRQSWAMFSPGTAVENSVLALPWVLPGASKTRQGNGFARQGRWNMAEDAWQQAVSKHPRNTAAWNNLAIASVAKQDFELARNRVQHAKTIATWDRARKTERWIDLKQQEFNQAFGLPDREQGWLSPLVPKPPAWVKPDESTFTPVEPVDIDELPWWTAIPGTKPPGWTWKKWLTQPIF